MLVDAPPVERRVHPSDRHQGDEHLTGIEADERTIERGIRSAASPWLRDPDAPPPEMQGMYYLG